MYKIKISKLIMDQYLLFRYRHMGRHIYLILLH